jgi:hypothetical protein
MADDHLAHEAHLVMCNPETTLTPLGCMPENRAGVSNNFSKLRRLRHADQCRIQFGFLGKKRDAAGHILRISRPDYRKFRSWARGQEGRLCLAWFGRHHGRNPAGWRTGVRLARKRRDDRTRTDCAGNQKAVTVFTVTAGITRRPANSSISQALRLRLTPRSRPPRLRANAE